MDITVKSEQLCTGGGAVEERETTIYFYETPFGSLYATTIKAHAIVPIIFAIKIIHPHITVGMSDKTKEQLVKLAINELEVKSLIRFNKNGEIFAKTH